jgi:class 3 adenylate cyclase/tetratricopeptide (TPR) repeat protein
VAQALRGTAAVDRPEAYIASDRRLALATGAELPLRSDGAALFADVSGFTALSELLAAELGGHRASEELTAHLNRVFHSIIEEVDRFGGSVIYFSGDAITCWFDGDDGDRAVTAGFAMLEALAREGHVPVGPEQSLQLEMKVAVAAGSTQRFVVGDPDILLLDVLAGSALDRLAAAEHVALRGEVVVGAEAMHRLDGNLLLSETRTNEHGDTVGVVERLARPAAPCPPPAPPRELEPDEVRPWLLPAVYERMQEGRGEFLAELRPAVPLFLRFGGIDFEQDDAVAQLDDFVRAAQRVLARFGGSALQITLGDKGAYLYAIFGAPVAHEDDTARAVSAAAELRSLGGVSDIQIGITRGRLRSGTYGHAYRRTYCCLGDAVNLAARLMIAADPGQILVDESARAAAGDAFAWEELEPLELKGKTSPVRSFSLQGSALRQVRLEARYELPLIGRHQELAAIAGSLAEAAAGRGRALGVVADAGIGKSRLLAEAARQAVEAGASVLAGECQAFGTNTSYFVWRPIWRALLGADGGVADVERALRAIDPALVPRLPLLAPLLGIPIPDNDLTRSFDAKLRKESLEGLAAQCLRAFAGARPLVFVLEDCHWLDPLSDDLLVALAREAVRLPVAFLLAYRPTVEGEDPPRATTLAHFVEVPLTELEDDDAVQLVRATFGRLFGNEREASRRLVDLVTERAQGNPFYIEELLSFIRQSDVDPHDDAAMRDLELPDSLHSMILSRIDRLEEQPRHTLKVASVVGRIFRVRTLPGVYPELGDLEQVHRTLERLQRLDLVTVDDEAGEAYVFKHVITQQVAYESLPFAVREMLHERVGTYIEASEPSLDRHLNLLAHHYSLSANDDKKRAFLRRAADAAQSEYANDVAIEWYRKLVPLLDASARGSVLLKLGKVLETVGNWDEAEDGYLKALELAAVDGDRSAVAWAETALAGAPRHRPEGARTRGQDDAQERFDRALRVFRELGDLEGQGHVLHTAGRFAAQRGDYEEARRCFEDSLHIRLELGDKPSIGGLYSNLGIIAEYLGDLDRARALHEQGVAVRLEAGDRWGVSVSLSNLGNIARLQGNLDEARERLEEALQLQSEVGDRWYFANVQNNLANVLREQGDLPAAAALYAEALQTFGDMADSWALAYLFEDVAQLAAAAGSVEPAFALVGAADARRDEIGTPRPPTDEQTLQDALAAAHDGLDGSVLEAATAEGRTLALADAVAAARRVCTTLPAQA